MQNLSPFILREGPLHKNRFVTSVQLYDSEGVGKLCGMTRNKFRNSCFLVFRLKLLYKQFPAREGYVNFEG